MMIIIPVNFFCIGFARLLLSSNILKFQPRVCIGEMITFNMGDCDIQKIVASKILANTVSGKRKLGHPKA